MAYYAIAISEESEVYNLGTKMRRWIKNHIYIYIGFLFAWKKGNYFALCLFLFFRQLVFYFFLFLFVFFLWSCLFLEPLDTAGGSQNASGVNFGEAFCESRAGVRSSSVHSPTKCLLQCSQETTMYISGSINRLLLFVLY